MQSKMFDNLFNTDNVNEIIKVNGVFIELHSNFFPVTTKTFTFTYKDWEFTTDQLRDEITWNKILAYCILREEYLDWTDRIEALFVMNNLTR